MRLWRKGSAVLLFLALASAIRSQSPAGKPVARNVASHRAYELTLAGLRPGKDSLARARQLNRRIDSKSVTRDTQTVWSDVCRRQILAVDFDAEQTVQVIRAAASAEPAAHCAGPESVTWKTGRGLGVGDSAAKLLALYGEPDSRSPSTKGGQPLELWYYAFDWAGANVPQVMEVLCTVGNGGQPGRVVEITLAAPSL